MPAFRFAIGVALNPDAEDLEPEAARFHRKIEAGPEWAQTQPFYDLNLLERFFEKAGPSPIPIVVGILPLHSSRRPASSPWPRGRALILSRRPCEAPHACHESRTVRQTGAASISLSPSVRNLTGGPPHT
ncbi:MAG: methylenetetrahydrofolate reductase [Candidatus Methylomirabilia bacterium]